MPEDNTLSHLSEPTSIAEPDPPQPSAPPLSSRSRPALLFGPDGLRAGWSLLLFLFLLAILIAPARFLISRGQPHTTASTAPTPARQTSPEARSAGSTIRGDGILFVVVAIATFVMSRIERRPFAAYGIGATAGALRQFVTGLLWGLLFLSLLVWLLTATHLLTFDSRLLSGSAILHYGAEWALGFLLVGLFEEFFLRGFVQFTLARGLSGIFGAISKTPHRDAIGFWTAAVLLSFVFGIGHRSNPGESPLGLLAAGAAALVFALSLWRTGSLWWAIGFHAAWDWAQSFLYGVADSGIIMQHHLLASHPFGRPLLSGGLTGPEGSIFVFPILILACVAIWTTLPRLPRPHPSRPDSPSRDQLVQPT